MPMTGVVEAPLRFAALQSLLPTEYPGEHDDVGGGNLLHQSYWTQW